MKAVYCPFVQDSGAGMGLEVFSLFLFGAVGLGLTIRTQHPGPILIAGLLTAGVVASTLPGQASRIIALVVFFALSGVGLYLYQRAKRTL